jgi:hypothetical protein
MLALIALVLVAAVFPPLHELTIALCAIVWPGVGTLYGLVIMVMGALEGMGKGKALDNFSSFDPAEERNFVVFERQMQANTSSASGMALVGSGLLGAVMVAIVLLFGSPHHEGPNAETGKAAPAAAEKH